MLPAGGVGGQIGAGVTAMVRTEGGQKARRTGAWLGLCVSMLLLSMPAALAGGSGKVLIGFTGRPNLIALARLGARVEYAYDLVPAVAAAVPQRSLAAIRRLRGVAYIEPDYPVYATGSTRHAWTFSRFSIQFDPGTEVLPWGIERILAPAVWLGVPGQIPPNTGAEVRVGIIDTGIDYTHADLAASYVLGYDFVNKDWDPLDDNGHGTHVAGIIAADDDGPNYGGANPGGISVAGAAPHAMLYVAKSLDRNGVGSTSSVVAALDVAAQYGVDVVNMSLGSPFSSRTLKSACDRAYQAGVLIVAAAGNEALPWLDTPARYSSVISVGAIDQSDRRAAFSNYNKRLELCAPGVGVLSSMPGYTVALNQAPYGYQTDYDYLSGTSMACPHVTGVAALVIAAHPTWTSVQVRQQLTSTATDLGAPGRDRYYGYGLVNAAEAAM